MTIISSQRTRDEMTRSLTVYIYLYYSMQINPAAYSPRLRAPRPRPIMLRCCDSILNPARKPGQFALEFAGDQHLSPRFGPEPPATCSSRCIMEKYCWALRVNIQRITPTGLKVLRIRIIRRGHLCENSVKSRPSREAATIGEIWRACAQVTTLNIRCQCLQH